MNRNTVFSQLLQLICQYRFKKCVDRYEGDRYTKRLSCWQQLLVLLFAQSKGLTSLRDIEISLRSHHRKWYHLGLTSVARSTLADANTSRDADILKEVFYSLLNKCRDLAPRHRFMFKNPLYTFDSTLINVCLSLYPWATYRKKKGAFKLHTLLDHAGYLPSFVVMTDGKTHDINVVKDASYGVPALSPDSILLVDRAYIDYNWLYSLTKNRLFFVTRVKKNMNCMVLGQQELPKNDGVVADRRVRLTNYYQSRYYPESLRLVTVVDTETGEPVTFMTNNFTLDASTITELYKSRWQIETFFKWIKQNLRIKSFLGTSKNAVMTQIWAAMIYYLLLSFIKFQTRCRHSLHELTRIIGELLLDSAHLIEIIGVSLNSYDKVKRKELQLSLF
ncbi:IS4 family transposase [Candidatus Latescibacterota bacterium]